MNVHIKNSLMMHFKFLEKQEQTNPKSNKWKDIIKIRAEINEEEKQRSLKNF
jgi:hypothetical protein